MKMSAINNKNRTGIYVQKSAGVTTAGDGLVPQGDKSPVTQFKKYEKNHIKEGYSQGYCEGMKLTRKERRVAKYYKVDEMVAKKTTVPVTRRERNRLKREGSPIPSSSSSEINNKIQNYEPPETDDIFTSPGVEAGITEDFSSFARAGLKRKKIAALQRGNIEMDELFKTARQRMGLNGIHVYSSQPMNHEQLPDPAYYRFYLKLKKKEAKKIKDKEIAAFSQKFPIKIEIADKSHPFGEITLENQSLLYSALETTYQDYCATGRDLIKIGSCEYKSNILEISCKNIETVLFVEEHVSLYNRLWQGADLFVSREKVVYKRQKVVVHLRNYNITSEEFVKIFGKQNGLRTDHWKLLHKKDPMFGFWALFNVDEGSYKRIKESNGELYFFFETISFELDHKDDILNN